jgi:hypothetical protein
MPTPTTDRSPARGVSALPGCYILALGVFLLAGVVIWAVYTFLRQAEELKAFTDLEPAALALETPAADRVADVQRRLESFAEAATAGREAEMVLSLEDLNTMLTGFPRLEAVKPLLRVRQLGADATFTADIRFPLNALPGHRRFLNGELDGRFGAHPEAGLFVSVLDVRVPGRQVPAGFLEVYQRGIIPGKNFGFLDDMLIRNFREDPVFAMGLKRIARVQTHEDALIISTSKTKTSEAAENAQPTTEAPADEAESIKK